MLLCGCMEGWWIIGALSRVRMDMKVGEIGNRIQFCIILEELQNWLISEGSE